MRLASKLPGRKRNWCFPEIRNAVCKDGAKANEDREDLVPEVLRA
jgi:hypothetical protein